MTGVVLTPVPPSFSLYSAVSPLHSLHLSHLAPVPFVALKQASKTTDWTCQMVGISTLDLAGPSCDLTLWTCYQPGERSGPICRHPPHFLAVHSWQVPLLTPASLGRVIGDALRKPPHTDRREHCPVCFQYSCRIPSLAYTRAVNA